MDLFTTVALVGITALILKNDILELIVERTISVRLILALAFGVVVLIQ